MKKTSNKADKLKLALIPVLGVVLLAVMPGGDDDSSADVPELVQPSSAASSAGSATLTARKAVNWPRIPLKTVISHNPFVLVDPRAELDKSLLTAGITAPEVMTEVTLEEFMATDAAELDSSNDDELLDDLVAYFGDSNPDIQSQQRAINNEPAKEEVPADSHSQEDPSAESTLEDAQQELFRRRLLLAEIQRRPITMFMQSQTGNSALVDDHRVTEGEFIEEGILVTSINRDGIKFKVIDPSAQNADLK